MNYKFSDITEHYSLLTPHIMAQGLKNKRFWVTPYSSIIDWPSMFSPIEMQTWFALRGFGQCPLYPQYPVGRFFTDFGNPFVKVALECDGKEWHTDKNKDQNRDKILLREGWIVYRITGADCFRIEEGYDNLNYMEEDEVCATLANFYSSTIEGLIKAIAIFHFGYKTFNKYINEYELAAKCLLDRVSLNKTKCQEEFNDTICQKIEDVPIDLKRIARWY